MRIKVKILLFFVLHILSAECQHLSIIGSHLLPSNSNYKVFMSAQNIDENSILNVTIKGSDGYEKIESFSRLGSSFKEVEFELPEAPQAEVKLLVMHLNKTDGTCKEQSVQLMDMSQRPIIFIQTDKPMYSTGDEVKFRIFILNQSLKPFEYQNMDVAIYDPNDRVIDQFSNIKRSDFGIFEESIKLADSLSQGKWKIQVKVNGYKKSKVFEVQHASNIQVSLEVDKVIAFIKRHFTLNIWVRNSQQKLFSGTAEISISGNFISDNREDLHLTTKSLRVKNGKNSILLDLMNDLNIQLPNKDMILKFKVIVTEDVTEESSTAQTEVRMQKHGAHTINLEKEKFFRPGIKFPMKIRVKHLNGQPDNSFNRVILHVNYESQNVYKERRSDEKKRIIDLKNGYASIMLEPTAETIRITLDLEFAGTELKDVIYVMPDFKADEFMQVKVIKRSSKIGAIIPVSVTAAEDMNELRMLVIGPQGVVASQHFPEAHGRDVYNFTFELTEDMRPESDVIVYYIKESNGAIVYDTIHLVPGAYWDNSLNVTAPAVVRPNESINLHISSEDGSKIFITAIDANADDPNEISMESLYNEFIQYKYTNFPDPSGQNLGKFNAFLMQPLSAGVPCGSSYANEVNDLQNMNLDVMQPTNAEIIGQKYIPEMWFQESFEIANDKTHQVTVPNSLTSWKIQAISMHREKGFAVTPEESKIDVTSGIAINVYAPSTIQIGEVFEVKFSAFNYLSRSVKASVDVEVKNGLFMDDENEDDEKNGCKKFKALRDQRMRKSMTIPAETMSELHSFNIQAIGNSPVEILVRINGNGEKDEIEKIVNIYDDRRQREPQNIGLKSDPIGPALEGLDRIFPIDYSFGEYKINKFKAAIVALKYSETLYPDIANDALRRIKIGYQEALYMLNSILPGQDSKDIHRVAQIASNLIEAKELIFVDERSILYCLDFLKNQQQSDGSFPFSASTSLRRDFGNTAFQKYIFTALAIEPFLKDENYKKQFQEEVTKSINFLKNSADSYINDYEKAVVAYVMVLNGDQDASKKLIGSIANNFIRSTKSKFMSMFAEIASYLVMTKIKVQMNATNEVNWLLSKRNYFGAYYSPYDTVLALQALYEFKKSGGVANFNMPRPDEQVTDFEIHANGKADKNGGAIINIEAKMTKNDIAKTNLVVLEVTLPSGYKYDGYIDAEHVIGVEEKDNGNLVLMYISGMEKDKAYKMFIKAKKIFDVANVNGVPVKIYDYYRPNLKSISFYIYDMNADICGGRADEEKSKNEEGLFAKFINYSKSFIKKITFF